jgi:tetratricopeptide (TPR) repeat protein
MIKLFRTALFLLCTVVSAPAMAQDFDEGLAAFQAGDYATALQEWRPLAEQGYASAQFNLGVMYDSGRGVTQDYAEAVNWYRRAAEQGDSMAQILLSAMYFDGRGVLQDAVLAHMWYNIGRANDEYQIGSGNRGRIEERMTREQIAEAQALARRCMASDYQDCD